MDTSSGDGATIVCSTINIFTIRARPFDLVCCLIQPVVYHYITYIGDFYYNIIQLLWKNIIQLTLII